jgi:hypothetical protein
MTLPKQKKPSLHQILKLINQLSLEDQKELHRAFLKYRASTDELIIKERLMKIPVSRLPDKDMQKAPKALARAAIRAKELARETGTAFVVMRNGKLVREIPPKISICQLCQKFYLEFSSLKL